MALDRFLSASLAGSSVSLNFKNWHHRICRDEGISSPAEAGTGPPAHQRRQAHLDLLEAGGELALLKGSCVVPDPLQEQQHQLPVLLPAQLQLLQAQGRQGCRGHRAPPPTPPSRPQATGPAAHPASGPQAHIGLHPVLHVGHTGHGVVQG